MTGEVRFMQKSGYPFPLLTPQMTATLAETATAGSNTARLQGTRLLPWLIPGTVVSFELVETVVVTSVSVLEDGNTLLLLQENIVGDHTADTTVHIRGFYANPNASTLDGEGGLGAPPVPILTPFILVPGDVFTVNGAKFTLSTAVEVSAGPSGYVYSVSTVERDGFPAMSSSTDILVTAQAAYRSSILNVPHLNDRSAVKGPMVVDWVSGPVVVDYTPTPESRLFIEEFDAGAKPITTQREIKKNDTLTRFPILRDQMLFWKTAEGGLNWNGTFTELRAFDSGRAHLWTPARPPIDAAPFVTKTATVPSFPPYAVLLSSNIRPDSATIIHAITRAQIPSTDYTVNSATGVVSFVAAYANQPVVVTYQPRLEWQLFARPSVDNVELTVTIGREPKQVFTLGAAGSANTLIIQTIGAADVDQIHVTARRQNDGAGPFIVELGDWTPRGSQTAAVRYVISTASDLDYQWASSGLMFKVMWPTIDLLRARLDGESLFARYLDNGRLVL